MIYVKNSSYGIKFEEVPILTDTDAQYYDGSLPKITYKFMRTARKSHTCEMCGSEIHKGEFIWWYKPRPFYYKGLRKYFGWRKRCFDCEPKSYAELEVILARELTHGVY